VNKLVVQAIADLEQYWGQQFPELYEKDFEPISGGYYAIYPSTDDPPPCASDASEVAGNAFYCSTKDVVAWDAEGLLPALQESYGDFVIPVVMAHEWAMRCRPARISPRARSPKSCRRTASRAPGQSTPRRTAYST
jgi:hypothetical protein